MTALDAVVTFAKAVASALIGREPVFNLTGAGGFRLDASGNVAGADDADEAGEVAADQFGYSSLGLIARPLPPDADGFAEAAALRVDGGLAPFAWRDLRLFQRLGGAGDTPAPGQTMLAGYGGAFLAFSVNAAGDNVSTWYVPFSRDSGGTPQNAHAISIDPTDGNSSITILHAAGPSITLTEDGITLAVDGQTFATLRAGELTVNAAKIMLKGNVYLGALAEAGLPLLAGVVSPPSPSVFVSPV